MRTHLCVCILGVWSSFFSLHAGTLLISEIRTRGPSGATDDFVEIYNASFRDVNLTGASLYYSSSISSNIRLALISGGTLPSGCRFLFASSNFSGSTVPDFLYAGSIADGGVATWLRPGCWPLLGGYRQRSFCNA